MRAAVFFVYIFLMLIGGIGSSFARINVHDGCCSSRTIKKPIPEKVFRSVTEKTLVTQSGLPAENEYLIFEDVVDEDASDVSPRKCKSLVGLFSPSLPSDLSNFDHHYTKPLSFIGVLVSCRYIVYRTLRI